MGLTSSEDSQCPLTPSSAADTASSPVIYYGVWQPPNSSAISVSNHEGVFTDRKDALQIVKNNREARFKAFKSYEEAFQFSKNAPVQLVALHFNGSSSESPEVNSISEMAVGQTALIEKGSAFRAPKTQDLVKLRKAIQVGDLPYAKQMIWANPRYLVSSGDSPTILHEGSRFNALHVASNSKQPTLCLFVLETIEDPKFMQLLYSDDSEHTRIQRINNLVDLYLNMPDKGLCETPLHFAAKYGCVEIVRMLVTHPACDRHLKNKYDQTAKDIICSRCSSPNKDQKMQIERLFEDQYFVPVLASEDNASQPYVGEPFSPIGRNRFLSLPADGSCPLQPSYIVRAYAGPMSCIRAKEMHQRWKKPFEKCSTPTSGCKRLLNIRLSDSDKGLERIGRELAKELNVPWAEKWPFVEIYCDLSKHEGLSKLETHLRNMDIELGLKMANFNGQDSYLWHHFEIDKKYTTASGVRQTTKDLTNSCSSEQGSGVSLTSNCSSLQGLCDIFRTLNLNLSAESDWSKTTGLLEVHLNDVVDNSRQEDKSLAQSSFKITNAQYTPPPLQELSTKRLVDQVCLDVARRMAFQLHERMAAGKTCSGKNFLEHLRPGIECLIRVVQHLLIVNSVDINLKRLHFVIAQLIQSNLDNDCLFTQDLSDIHHWIDSSGSDYLTTSSDNDDDCDEVPQWRRCSHINDLMAEMVLHHIRCILSQLKTWMGSDLDASNGSHDCSCNWKPNLISAECRMTDAEIGVSTQMTGENKECKFRKRWTSGPSRVQCDSDQCSRVDVQCEKEECSSYASEKWPIIDSEVAAVSDDSISDLFFTPPHSSRSSLGSSLNDVHTPDEGIPVFINGSEPSKLDVDVLRALESVQVDPVIYPHIHRWQMLMSTFSKEEVERWASPFVRRWPHSWQTPGSVNFASSFINPSVFSSSPEMRSRDSGCSRTSLKGEDRPESLWSSRTPRLTRHSTGSSYSLSSQDYPRRKIF